MMSLESQNIQMDYESAGRLPQPISFWLFLGSIAWLLYAVIRLDQRWWWFLVIVCVVGISTLILNKDYLYRPSKLRDKMTHALYLATLLTCLFVIISALFISPRWWFGLFLVVALMGVFGSFDADFDEETSGLTDSDKHKLNTWGMAIFTFIFVFFCIPSFMANAKRNPQDRFGSEYRTVESYSIYADTTMNSRNMEHIIPRSWYQTEEHYVNDHVNVIWSNLTANNQRGNLPFGEVPKNQDTAIYAYGEIVGYKDDQHFMPTDEFKGDVARIVLHMAMIYRNNGLDLECIDLNLMKKWSRQDQIDHREIERNELLKSTYGYGNRFVSRPWLVRFIALKG